MHPVREDTDYGICLKNCPPFINSKSGNFAARNSVGIGKNLPIHSRSAATVMLEVRSRSREGIFETRLCREGSGLFDDVPQDGFEVTGEFGGVAERAVYNLIAS